MREHAAYTSLASHAMAQRELAKMDNALAAYYAAKRNGTPVQRRTTDKVKP